MSLINCPECGNECSSTAISCPQCGYAFVRPSVAPPKVIVREVEREDSFPKWIFIPLALLGVVILFVLFVMLRKDDPDQRNINVNLATARQSQTERNNAQTSSMPSTSQPSTVTVPSTSQPSTVTMPQTEQLPPPTTVTGVPSTNIPGTVAAPPAKGAVMMEAKVISKNGRPQPASRVKFYLLDKDLDSILAEANIEDETGEGALTAFGLSSVDPNRYRETYQKANNAIKKHIVYSTTSDATGKAQLKDVEPKNYYLFAVTTTRNGFAIWNSPVFINNGDNVLNLSPATLTEVVSSTDSEDNQ